ncbi:hypothetical protein [Pseudomonas oryzihabitans]|uniref:hypothetical protein n=1 Tax=Pseudomonas oryzihabitans TaxID=47885 RepID=UPI001238FD90|nr:hypothetical protein [Pseudomonas oryzihabitans]QEU03284.1 hypothetical protein FOB65_08210 [Pseudomonas oryzihabitans]QEU03294.1 hypothetical protein FOB65_08265 [Pseudomonas oryzihabitans]
MFINSAVIEGPCHECGKVDCLTNLYPMENPEQVWLCQDCEQRILEDADAVGESVDDFYR